VTHDDAAIADRLRQLADHLADRVEPHVSAVGVIDIPPRRRWAPTFAAGFVALAVLVGGSSMILLDRREPVTTDESVAAPTSTTESLPSESTASSSSTLPAPNTTTVPVTEGAWSWARSSEDGRQLLIWIVGSAPFEEDDGCTADYRTETTESDAEVVVEIIEVRVAGAFRCRLIGFTRVLTVDLAEQFGQRRLIALGQARQVFDGTSLSTVSAVPAEWALLDEGSAGPTTWRRSWGPDRPTGSSTCEPGPAGVALIEGPSIGAGGPPDPEPLETQAGEYDVRGATAVLFRGSDGLVSRLVWALNDRSLEIRRRVVCDGDLDLPLDTLLAFARGVEPPTRSEGTRAPTPGAWTQLPDPPLAPRTQPLVARIGSELFMIGGHDRLCPAGDSCAFDTEWTWFRDGAAFDLFRRRASSSPGTSTPRSGHLARRLSSGSGATPRQPTSGRR
jgi:hypothetical protein